MNNSTIKIWFVPVIGVVLFLVAGVTLSSLFDNVLTGFTVLAGAIGIVAFFLNRAVD
jgi:hypothetical protein